MPNVAPHGRVSCLIVLEGGYRTRCTHHVCIGVTPHTYTPRSQGSACVSRCQRYEHCTYGTMSPTAPTRSVWWLPVGITVTYIHQIVIGCLPPLSPLPHVGSTCALSITLKGQCMQSTPSRTGDPETTLRLAEREQVDEAAFQCFSPYSGIGGGGLPRDWYTIFRPGQLKNRR